MSNTIDQRVVEMRFDNSQFEKNVATTMTTLEKLKQKLNLSGATKGLENMNAAAKSNSMPVLGNAVEAVSAKFSALQVMGVTALANITNSAVNAGKRIVKSLTIDPIKSGFEEYETKMGSIQTILANTEHQGTTLDDVTAALDKLNTYADKTIYNFQQMTKNIGTFTAAGVDLQTSVNSIQGIANLAAVSGSTSQQASTAMYQLSQALASGTVKLQDWNSVVNAGMGGKVFQNALIRTAAMLDGASEDVEAWQKAHIDAYGSFRESLSKEQWLTTEVLTRTLEQFTMAAEEGSDEWNEFKKSLMESGYTEAQAEEILKMANTATDAATKVKTFTQLMDTLKESAQSGWAQTWELIVGDFEEAKAFFTELSDIFGGIIGKSADRRNTFLGEALSSNWDKLISKINEAGIETSKFEESIRKIVGDDKLDAIIQDFGSLEKAVREGGISSEILKKALDGIGLSKADGKIASFVDGLKEIEGLLRRGNVGEDVKKLQTALDELGYDLGEFGVDGIIGPVTEKAIKVFQEANNILVDGIAGPETLAALEKAGSKIEDTTENVDGLIDSCDDLVDVITEKSGRELILDSLMNIVKAIQRPIEAVGEALRDTFSISPKQLYKSLEGINEFTKKLVPKGILEVETWEDLLKKVNEFGVGTNDFVNSLKSTLSSHGIDVDELTKKYGSLGHAFEEGAISFDLIKEALKGFDGITESLLNGGETADKVRRTFEGLFAIVDTVATILAGPFKFAFKIVTEVLGRMGLSVLDVTARIGDGFVKLRDNVDKVIDAITKFIVDNVTEWIEQFRETEFFKTVAGWFADASETISDAVDNISNKISSFTSTKLFSNFIYAWNYLLDVVDKIKSSKIGSKVIDGFVTTFGKLKDFFGKFKLPELSLDNLKTWATDLVKIGEKISSNGKGGFLGAISGFGQHLKDNVLSWNWTVFKESALEKFVNFWLTTGDKIKSAFEKGQEVAQAIKRFIFGAEEVDLPTILSVAEKFLGILVLVKALNLLNGIVEPFDNITDALNNFAASMKWKAVSGAFKSMALALGAFTLCIIVLTQLPDMNKAWQAAGMLAGLMIIMGGVVTAMGLIAAKADSGLDTAGVAFSLLALMGALVLLVYAIKEIDKMELKDPSRTFNILIGVLLAMTLGVAAISKAGGSSFRSVAAILTMMAALKMLLDVIDAYEEYDWIGKRDAIKRVMEMLVGLSVALRIASGGTKAGASSTGLALLLFSMVISLKMMVGIMEDFSAMDESTIKKGGAVVMALLGAFTAMALVLNLTSESNVLEKGQKSVNNFAGLAMALLAVVASIWLLGKMDIETLKQGGYAVGQILLLFTAMLGTLGATCSGLKMGPIITLLIAFGLLMAEMAVIVKYLEYVPWQQSLGSASALSLMMLAIAGVLKIVTKSDVKAKNIAKWVGAMIALTGLVAILAFVLYSIKDMNPTNAIGSAIALSGILAAMSGVLHILSALDMRKLSSNKMQKLAIAFLGMSAILGALAFILYSIKDMDPTSAIGNAAALSILISVMTGALFALSKIKVNVKNTGAAVLGLAALGLVIWELGAILSHINQMNMGDAMPAVKALSTLIIVLTVVLAALTGLGALMAMSGFTVAGGMAIALVGLAALGLVVWELGAILYAMKSYNLGEAMPMVEVLSKLLIVLTGVLAALAVIGLLGVPALAGVLAMAALGLVVWELGAILNAMRDYNLGEAMPMVTTLSALLESLTDALKVLTVIGVFGAAALVGVILLGGLALELGLLMWGLSKIKDTETARANVETINALLGPLSAMIVMVAMMGPKALIAVGAISGMVLLVEGLTLFAGAVGALANLFGDGVETAIERGLGILKIVAGGLGEIIGAFMSSLTADLPTIADNLSQFTEKLNPFVTAVSGIDDSVATGAGNLMKAILAIIAADAITDLMTFMSSGRLSLTTLAEELCGFAEGAEPFMESMKGMDAEAATGVESLCNALNTLISANIKDSWSQLIPGDNSLSTFGENISTFAGCIKDAAASLSGITDQDVENIKKAATAGEALATLNGIIPAQGGWWQKLAGEKDIADWGTKISAFADSLVAYSAKVSGQTIDSEAIKSSAEAATSVSDLNAAIPRSDGLWQDIAGAQDLATWGTKINAFADALVSYSSKVAGASIDKDAILRSAEGASAIAEVNNKIPTSGGIWDWIAGEQDLTAFGTGLTSLASGIVAYANAAVQIDDDKIDAIKKSGTAVDEIKAVSDKLPSTGGVGGLLWGEKDPLAFGNGVSALANGIKTCVNVATTITDEDITAIGNLGSAIGKIEEVFTEVPEVNTEYTANFKTAIGHLKSACSSMNTLSTAGYDFSGLDTIKSGIKKVINILIDVSVSSIYEDFELLKQTISNVSSCAQSLASLNNYTYGGVDTLKGALNSLAEANVDGVINTFSGKTEAMNAAVSSIVNSLSSGLSVGSTRVSTAATDVASAAVKAVEDKKGSFQTAGQVLIDGLIIGIRSKFKDTATAGQTAGSKAGAGAILAYGLMYSNGVNLGQGLVQGINSMQDRAYWAGYRLGQKAVEGEKAGQASNSPSKLTIKAGKWIGEGLVIGMTRMGKAVYNAGKSMGNTAVGSISKSIRTISDAINTDIDSQPTIRPVLDLSDIRAGAGAINGLLGAGAPIGVQANINSISSMMNNRNQNGANGDIITAIDRLRKDLSNIGNTTYSINGVTYDDGSNITEAVKTIVRAARIERRI